MRRQLYTTNIKNYSKKVKICYGIMDIGRTTERMMAMVRKEEFYYDSQDKLTKIHAVRWVPEGKPRAVLQIVHGMVEYVDRYDHFARYMAEHGFVVVGNDHLGHGLSVNSDEDLGYFAEKHGNQIVLKDIHRLKKLTQVKFPHLPYFILGHSMGSFLLRQYLLRYGDSLSGAVIMGTGNQPKLILRAGRILCRLIAKAKGWRYRSPLVDSMAFGSYNKKFRNEGCEVSWLTKDREIVKAYQSDKLCTFKFTLNAYYNMMTGMYELLKEDNLQRMPKDLPLFLVSGRDDPVGDFGRSVDGLYEQYIALGMTNVKRKLYDRDRHEILNEQDKETVFEDLRQWFDQQLETAVEPKV